LLNLAEGMKWGDATIMGAMSSDNSEAKVSSSGRSER
jgi:hypothetical protein